MKNGTAVAADLLGVLLATLLIAGCTASVQQTPAADGTPVAQTIGDADGATRLPKQEGFSAGILATGFEAPWNILYGPDGVLWITQRAGKKITRVDPESGSKIGSMPVHGVYQSSSQDGLLGMAFDPGFKKTRHIYAAYTYDADPAVAVERRVKITRFTYEAAGGTLGGPVDLISGLPGSGDHNSGRMTFGPDGKLYYTIGDQGKNYFTRPCEEIQAQVLPTAQEVAARDWTAYQGKVLRINPDGSIPSDNPMINGVRSHVFTYGHRNAQGIAVGPKGAIYVSEHGDKSDDEFNRLQKGGNYGWPYVSGYNDDRAYQYVNWSGAKNCRDLRLDNVNPPPPGVPAVNESEFNAPDFAPPLRTFYTVSTGHNFRDPACGNLAYVCWPTVAPSSLRLYTAGAIPGWKNTFLMPTLKGGRIFQLALNGDGTAVAGEPVELFRSENRYRDLAFGPDGRTIYVITDTSGPVQAIKGGATTELLNPGSLLVFRYEGRR